MNKIPSRVPNSVTKNENPTKSPGPGTKRQKKQQKARGTMRNYEKTTKGLGPSPKTEEKKHIPKTFKVILK